MNVNLFGVYAYLGVCEVRIAAAVFANEGKADNSADWFYPAWAAEAKYNQPIVVLGGPFEITIN